MSSGSGEHREIERKYDAGPGFRLPSLAGLPGVAGVMPPRTQRLTATYYDTAGLRLAAARVTLRRRTGGEDAGWHLKLPVSGDTRREIRRPPGRSGQPVPAELADLVAAWTGGQPLRPVARLRTTRVVRHLVGPAGRLLAEVADDHVHGARAVPPAAGRGRPQPDGDTGLAWAEPVNWREIEVELVTGSRELLEAVDRRLAEAGVAPARSASKLARLLATAS